MRTEIQFSHLQAEREVSKSIKRHAALEYPMDLYIQEVKRVGETKAVISFTLKTVTNPEIASFTVSGALSLEGTPEEVDAWITPVVKEPPRVWRDVYQESVNILSIMAKVIEVPFPTPKIGGITVGR